jgi:hypothetical protein
VRRGGRARRSNRSTTRFERTSDMARTVGEVMTTEVPVTDRDIVVRAVAE